MQNQCDVIKADDSTKRFGYARKETSQVSVAGDRTRERHHSLIKRLFAGAVRTADQDGGVHRYDGPGFRDYAPPEFGLGGDTVKVEFAPVLGFQIHVIHDLSSFAVSASRMTRSLSTEYGKEPTPYRHGAA